MRISGYLLIVFMLLITSAASPQEVKVVDFTVVPSGYDAIPGTATFLGPLTSTQRTYQLLINEDQLTSHMNKDLTGISFRLPASATDNWPAADVLYSNYDIYLSGSVHPSLRSLTFADNVVGPQTLVRSGNLSITAGLYPAGKSPNDFGKEITFDSVWTYKGGHVLIEIRHAGSNGSSRSVDAISTSTSGYGTSVSAAWTGSYTGTSGSQGNFAVVRISAVDPIPVELTSFTASVVMNNVGLNWSTATELNNYGFDVERLSDNNWVKIGFVPGAGTSTEPTSYSYSDNNLSSGKYTYRLRQIDIDGTASYSNTAEAEISGSPDYSLGQNYPNPFNPVTSIEFSLKEKANVRLSIYNSIGEEVAVLLNQEQESGYHKIAFNASDLMSGVYYYEIIAGSFHSVKKMLLLK